MVKLIKNKKKTPTHTPQPWVLPLAFSFLFRFVLGQWALRLNCAP